MLKDRGTIKWTSLMLPEHVQMLKNMWKEEEKIEQPIIDEQLLDELNGHLKKALSQNKTVRLTIYVNGQKEVIIGNIKHLCEITQTMTLLLMDMMERTIPMTSILSIEEVENY